MKGLTEYLAPTVVKTPATSATTVVLEPEIDPSQFGMSVPENTLITLSHNRRFDWEMFSGNLKAVTFKAEPKDKPVMHHKAPPVFVWPENDNWDCMERIAPRLELPVPEPWSNPEYAEIVETALDPLSKRVKDHQSAFNNWIWTWAYKDPWKEGDDHRIPDKYPLGVFLTILWMAGLNGASVKKGVPVERLFSEEEKSDLIRFLARCTEVIDSRVRKAISHYGHMPIWYESGDGTQSYPNTDTLWADMGKRHVFLAVLKEGIFQGVSPES